MSLESALDEERREVMDLLEGRSSQNRAPTASQIGRTSSPAPQIRSMLDVGGPSTSRRGSAASQSKGVTSLPQRSGPPSGIRSMLDPLNPPPVRITHSTTTSPTETSPPAGSLHRTQSDAASHPPGGRPRAGSNKDRHFQSNYQFDVLPTVQGQALPKRVTQGGKKQLQRNAMASIMQGQELDPLPRSRDRGRHNSTAGILGGTSHSPSSRLSNRSQSPGGSMLNTNSFNLMPTPGKFVTDGGKVIDLNSAYRRLSDANLLKSGGNLSSLPSKNPTERARVGSGEVLSPTGEVRLQKDYYDDEEALQTSEEEHSSDEDGWGVRGVRGRRRSRRKKGATENEETENDTAASSGPIGMGRSSGPRMVKSLMAAAEEERKCFVLILLIIYFLPYNYLYIYIYIFITTHYRPEYLFKLQSQIFARTCPHGHWSRRREATFEEAWNSSQY